MKARRPLENASGLGERGILPPGRHAARLGSRWLPAAIALWALAVLMLGAPGCSRRNAPFVQVVPTPTRPAYTQADVARAETARAATRQASSGTQPGADYAGVPAGTATPAPGTSAPAAACLEIAPEDAMQYVGHTVCLNLYVVHARKLELEAFLDSQEMYEGHFSVYIYHDLWNCWPEPVKTHFLHKWVRVWGTVRTYLTGWPEIVLDDCSNIQVLR